MKKLLQVLSLGFILSFALLGFAQENQMMDSDMESSVVHAAVHMSYGHYLTDAHGRALYVVVNGDETVPCEGECAAAWPPYTEESMSMMEGDMMESSEEMADSEEMAESDDMMGEAVDPMLIGTVMREDGTTQITYNGYPLYYFVGDTEAGVVNCQAVENFGGIWYILSPSGEINTTSN